MKAANKLNEQQQCRLLTMLAERVMVLIGNDEELTNIRHALHRLTSHDIDFMLGLGLTDREEILGVTAPGENCLCVTCKQAAEKIGVLQAEFDQKFLEGMRIGSCHQQTAENV